MSLRSFQSKFFLLSIFILSQQALALPTYQIWQGKRASHLDDTSFQQQMNSQFIPLTTQTIESSNEMKRSFFIHYLLPRREARSNAFKEIPDHVGLFVYSNPQELKKAQFSANGRRLESLKWSLFDEKKGSQSTVAVPFRGNYIQGVAYDVLESEADWKKGYAVVTLAEPIGDITAFIQMVKTRNPNVHGLNSYVMVEGELDGRRYVLDYQLWQDQMTWTLAHRGYYALRAQYLKPIFADKSPVGDPCPLQTSGDNIHLDFGRAVLLCHD